LVRAPKPTFQVTSLADTFNPDGTPTTGTLRWAVEQADNAITPSTITFELPAGPYIEAKEIVVSFGLIQADNYDGAVAIARECPPGHTIEIRELAGYA
jgi:hypothetical protein